MTSKGLGDGRLEEPVARHGVERRRGRRPLAEASNMKAGSTATLHGISTAKKVAPSDTPISR